MNPGASARKAKEACPENYCLNPRCLWRTRNGRTGEVTPCPKHPEAKPGMTLAVGLALDNLSLAVQHAPELAKGLEAAQDAIRGQRFRMAKLGLELVSAYFSRQDCPLTDDESIAARHLSAALAQVKVLANATEKAGPFAGSVASTSAPVAREARS